MKRCLTRLFVHIQFFFLVRWCPDYCEVRLFFWTNLKSCWIGQLSRCGFVTGLVTKTILFCLCWLIDGVFQEKQTWRCLCYTRSLIWGEVGGPLKFCEPAQKAPQGLIKGVIYKTRIFYKRKKKKSVSGHTCFVMMMMRVRRICWRQPTSRSPCRSWPVGRTSGTQEAGSHQSF